MGMQPSPTEAGESAGRSMTLAVHRKWVPENGHSQLDNCVLHVKAHVCVRMHVDSIGTAMSMFEMSWHSLAGFEDGWRSGRRLQSVPLSGMGTKMGFMLFEYLTRYPWGEDGEVEPYSMKLE